MASEIRREIVERVMARAGFFDAFIAPGRRDAAAVLSAGAELQKLWPELNVAPGDLRVSPAPKPTSASNAPRAMR
jgi:hypothetical protein